MNGVCQTDPAVEPLIGVLGYLTEVINLFERAGPVANPCPQPLRLILHQHEIENIPGLLCNSFDEDGPIWLAVERLSRVEPPPVDMELRIWIEVPDDPAKPPAVRPSVVISVDDAEKDRLIAAGEAREEDLEAVKVDGTTGIWNVRVRLEDRPHPAARLDAYVTGPWALWSETERKRRTAIAIYERLLEMSEVVRFADAEQPLEFVWGVGVARRGGDVSAGDEPVLERLIEIEVVDNSATQVRIRPRAARVLLNPRAFLSASPAAAPLAFDGVHRMLEALERNSELSPFVRETFEPLLTAIASLHDPQGHYQPGPGTKRAPASANLVISDQWMIFVRPRAWSYFRRDVDRMRDAIDREPIIGHWLPGPARALVLDLGKAWPASERRMLPGTIGGWIDSEPAPEVASPNRGDLFFPRPAADTHATIVRRLESSDGLVIELPPGAKKTDAIVNVICHYLALGARVLVVSRREGALVPLRERLPPAIQRLTISFATGEKEALLQAEGAVSQLQSIIDTLKPHEHVHLIGDIERDIIATRQQMAAIDAEVADVAQKILEGMPGFAAVPVDLARSIIAERGAHLWFEDRPPRLLADAQVLVASVDAARNARLRLGPQLRYIDDELPALAELPDEATFARVHEDLKPMLSSNDTPLARRIVVAMGINGATRLATDLEALCAARDVVSREPWLGLPSRPGEGKGGTAAAAAALVAFARDASPHLAWRTAFLSRSVDAPADAWARPDVMRIIDRLSAGQKVFTAFAFAERRLKGIVDSITVGNARPAGPDDWAHIRNCLNWCRDTELLVGRWNLLAPTLGAPVLDTEYPHVIQGLNRIVELIEVAIVAAASAEQRVMADAASKLSMLRHEIEAVFGDSDRLQALCAALRSAVATLGAARSELARLEGLLSGAGVVPAIVRTELLSRLGEDGVSVQEAEHCWARVRRAIQSHERCRDDFQLINDVSLLIAKAGAPVFAKQLRTEPADPKGGDVLLRRDWKRAWNWAALVRQIEEVGEHCRLRELVESRTALELKLHGLFEAVVAERTHLALLQSVSGPIKRALMVFMFAMRKMKLTGCSPLASRYLHEAMEECYEQIPCWIMPSWRVAEQLPAVIGAFDLVIIDEAWRSDVRELTILLRGRKILVIGEDGQVGPILSGVGNNTIERLEHDFLRTVAKTTRPFLLPGSSLYELAKVMFPNDFLRLDEQALA